jgi:hypothetical protein
MTLVSDGAPPGFMFPQGKPFGTGWELVIHLHIKLKTEILDNLLFACIVVQKQGESAGIE